MFIAVTTLDCFLSPEGLNPSSLTSSDASDREFRLIRALQKNQLQEGRPRREVEYQNDHSPPIKKLCLVVDLPLQRSAIPCSSATSRWRRIGPIGQRTGHPEMGCRGDAELCVRVLT